MTQVYIGIGSNIDPETHILQAIRQFAIIFHVTGISTFYRTQPLDDPQQPDYYNGVVGIETLLPPLVLKCNFLRPIEEQLGRWRDKNKYAARTIDLDLLIYGELIINNIQLVLPDPEIVHRSFLAVPLCELAPELQLSGIPITQIAATLGTTTLNPLPEFTRKLRALLG